MAACHLVGLSTHLIWPFWQFLTLPLPLAIAIAIVLPKAWGNCPDQGGNQNQYQTRKRPEFLPLHVLSPPS
jgi:hypothetical protein